MYSVINGKFIAETGTPAIDNGAFRYGYGLFETILMHNGALPFEGLHADRLRHGMQQLALQLPKHSTWEQLVIEMHELARRNRMERLCRIRLQVFAGGGGLYGKDRFKAGYIIECYPLEQAVTELNKNGLIMGVAANLAKSNDSVANLKSCNSLIYALAANQADEHKWNDALVCNTAGNIIESTIANIFWVKDGTLYTPPLTEGCVAGTMRQFILHKLEVTETPLNLQLLADADEVWLTNAIRKIRWIHTIEGVKERYEHEYARTTFNLLF